MSSDQLATAVAAAGIGVWSLQPDGRFWCSEGFAGLAGVTSGPQTRDALLALVHAEDRARVLRALGAAFDDAGPFTCECRVVRPDGWIIDLALTATLTAATATTDRRLQGVALDATRRRRLESRLIRSQRLEAIGLLAASLAHDFNNQLVAILGYAEFLQRVAPSADQRSDLGHILDAGRQAAGLTGQLLALSRRNELEPRALDLNAVVAGLRSMLRRLAGEDIVLETTFGADLPTIRADQSQLQQAIVNLAIAASAHPEAGGTIAITTGPAPDGAGGDSAVRVVVRRSGATDGPRAGASGASSPPHELDVALETAELIAQRSGGTLVTSLESDGQARVFELRFPAARAIEPDAPERPADAVVSPAGRETILVVDDEPAVRSLLASVLMRSGYTVLQAADAQQAQALAAVTPVALLCTDVVMPGGSGVDLYRALSAADPDLRVLYISGYPQRLLADRAALTTANFMRKPFLPADIVRRIRQLLDH